jgi:Tol biopolymer transport system component
MQWIRALKGRLTLLPAGLPAVAFALAFAGSFLYFSLVDDDGRADAPAAPNRSEGSGDAPAPTDRSDGRRGRAPAARLAVAFTATADEVGKGHLARVALDGSVVRMLLEPPGHGRQASNAAPAVSPDGTTVAFQRALWGPRGAHGPFIYVMRLDGSGAERRLTRGGAAEVDPAWSPDGTRIAFSREVEGRFDLFASAKNGSAATRLTRTQDFDELSPAWSPDGSRIVFARYESGVENGSGDLLLANADGTGETPLLRDEHDYSSPAWSPDGRRLALVRDGHLAVMGADAATPRPLTGATGPMEARPSWSSDGARIAFIREPGTIVVVAADGSHAVTVPFDKPANAAVWEPAP